MYRKTVHIAARGLLLAIMTFCSASLHAQTSFGQIAGNVTDASGGSVPGATVTITNEIGRAHV